MATYKLPFGGTVRCQSRRRYVLARDNADGSDGAFIVARSDRLSTLEAKLRSGTDYLIDQTKRTVTFRFNGRYESKEC